MKRELIGFGLSALWVWFLRYSRKLAEKAQQKEKEKDNV